MEIQLEINLENKSQEELRFSDFQRQIDMMNESFGKVRRRLFCELGEMKTMYIEIQKENEYLKTTVKGLRNEKTEWIYAQGDCLFDVREYKEA